MAKRGFNCHGFQLPTLLYIISAVGHVVSLEGFGSISFGAKLHTLCHFAVDLSVSSPMKLSPASSTTEAWEDFPLASTCFSCCANYQKMHRALLDPFVL